MAENSRGGNGPTDELVLAGVDTTKPSVARVYDMMLGGKDHYEVDREFYRRTMEIEPNAPLLAQVLRRWLIRVVRYLTTTAKVDQFLDCGSGLPTAENTHQVAQRINPEATVVYVDNDPMVIAHGRALLEENDHTHVVAADLRYPDDLFAHPVVSRSLDFDRPIALMQCATIHHVEDDENPRELMARYIELLPSGSYVLLSHFCDPDDGSEVSALAKAMEANLRSAIGRGRCRTPAEIESYLTGLEILEPGLVPVGEWWPEGPRLTPVMPIDFIGWGAVGRKP